VKFGLSGETGGTSGASPEQEKASPLKVRKNFCILRAIGMGFVVMNLATPTASVFGAEATATNLPPEPVLTRSASSTKIPDKIRPPTSTIEMINNLADAFDYDLLVQPEFYTIENIKRLSGAEFVTWRANDENRRAFWTTGFDLAVPPVKSGNFALPGLTYAISLQGLSSGKYKGIAEIFIGESHSELAFEKMEKFFGTNWENYISPIFGHDRYLGPSTNVHGNQRILYRSEDAATRRALRLEFRPDGTLVQISFNQETK
jgi:hypothetical protein